MTPLLEVTNLSVVYPARHSLLGGESREVTAVNRVSFVVNAGETLALVGESGSGKTTTGRAVLRLIEPTSGSIRFDGTDVRALASEPLRKLRRRMQMVFQDPLASLTPWLTIGSLIQEPIEVHGLARGDAARARVGALLEEVGLAASDYSRYPHEFSGGQRQRIAIARVLAVEPAFIVLDEAVSALDVTVQAQVLTLLERLQRDRGLAYLFIAHNLAVVARLANRVAVMQGGHLVETGTAADFFAGPVHPYSQQLLAAVPVPDPSTRPRV